MRKIKRRDKSDVFKKLKQSIYNDYYESSRHKRKLLIRLSEAINEYKIPPNASIYYFWLLRYVADPFTPQKVTFKEIKKELPHIVERTWIRSNELLVKRGLLLIAKKTTTHGSENWYYFFDEEDKKPGDKMALAAGAKMSVAYSTSNNILYNNTIYNNTNEKEKVNTVENRNKNKTVKYKKKANQKRIPLTTKKYIVKIKRKWNSLGLPFAQCKSSQHLDVALSTLLDKNKPLAIIGTINKAHDIMSRQNFILGNGLKRYLRDFLEVNTFAKDGKWLIENCKGRTWFEIFALQGDSWIHTELLKLPKLNQDEQDAMEGLKRIFTFSEPQHEVDKAMAIAAKQLCKLATESDDSFDTMLYDLKEFMNTRDTRNHKPYYYMSKDFWNNTFRPHYNHVRGKTVQPI
jgi:hypothetical protein